MKSDDEYIAFYRKYVDHGRVRTTDDSLIVSADYKNYLALYASARSQALQAVPNLAENKCNLDHYLSAIDLLTDLIAYDTSLTIKKVRSDNAFKGIENEYEFRVLIHHLSFENPDDVRSFIVDKTYRTSSPVFPIIPSLPCQSMMTTPGKKSFMRMPKKR
jgi:hypothetical protein